MVTEKEIWDALAGVYDPEIGISIVDLGLVYEVKAEGNRAYAKVTMTTPGCPMHAYITQAAKEALLRIEGVKTADVELTWEPPWTPDMLSDNAKKMLGYQG